MSRISYASACADISVVFGDLGGVCRSDLILAGWLVFNFSLLMTLPMVYALRLVGAYKSEEDKLK